MAAFELTLLIIFCLSFIIQMFYYWYFYSSLAFYQPEEKELEEWPPVSVVIAARNEYHNLVKHLPLVLSQDYPEFEVVVVNHASEDESGSYLLEISKKDPRLKVVNIERDLNFFTGKKFPLSLGIKSAAHEVLLLTDADCNPESDRWIRSMVSNYGSNTEIVLGYGPYLTSVGFANLVIRYDTFLVAMQYLSYALKGIPYMGVGRNLSYKRSMFFRNKGFTSHYRIASGDDDLFINQAASRTNTRICIQPGSFTYSEPAGTIKRWINQKRRHFTASKNYKSKFKVLLSLFGVSQLLFYLLFFALVILKIYPFVALGFLLARLLTLFIVHKKILSHFRDDQLLLFSLVWELFHLLILQIIALISMLRKPVEWK